MNLEYVIIEAVFMMSLLKTGVKSAKFITNSMVVCVLNDFEFVNIM